MYSLTAVNQTFSYKRLFEIINQSQDFLNNTEKKPSMGELAQEVERPLSMREAPGSMPGFSILLFLLIII